MREEISAIMDNETWTLMPPPPRGAHIISSHWTYKVKKLADSVVDCLKARFVVQGCSQIHGVDYNETYAPVICLETLWMVLAYALLHKLDVHQMDVTTAFLHTCIDGEVYICQPKGFTSINHPDWVCKLHKSLYGLKQWVTCIYVSHCLIIAHPNDIPTIKLILSSRFTMKDLGATTSILSIEINHDQENRKMQLRQCGQIDD